MIGEKIVCPECFKPGYVRYSKYQDKTYRIVYHVEDVENPRFLTCPQCITTDAKLPAAVRLRDDHISVRRQPPPPNPKKRKLNVRPAL